MVLRPGVNYIIYNEFSKIQVQGENKSSWPMFANWRKRGKMSKQTELYDSKWWLVLNSSQKGKFSRVTFQPQVWRLVLHISTNGNHDPMTQKYQATPGTLLSPANICVSIFKKCSFLGFFSYFYYSTSNALFRYQLWSQQKPIGTDFWDIVFFPSL